MKRAFSVCFPCLFDDGDEADVESASGQIDDDSMWENLEPSAEMELAAVFSRHSRKKRLTCYSHCLQLVVVDGLKETKTIRPALTKASHLCTLLHTSCLFKEAFEKTFGKE
jgi:hypothetical protein